MTETTKTPRQIKTARQRAQEALDKERGRMLRLDDKQAALSEKIEADTKERDRLLKELSTAEEACEHLAKHPALADSPAVDDAAQMGIEDVAAENDLPATGTQA